jgi:hypothetical protein
MITLKEASLVQHAFDLHVYNEEMEEHILHQFISRKDAAAILEHLNLKPKPKDKEASIVVQKSFQSN